MRAALTGVAQGVGYHPAKQKVSSSVRGKDVPELQARSPVGGVQETNGLSSQTGELTSLFLLSLLSKNINKIFFKKEMKVKHSTFPFGIK